MNGYSDYAKAYLRGERPDPAKYGVYAGSVRAVCDGVVFLADAANADVIVACPSDFGFVGERVANDCVAAPLTHENANVLRRLFPYTAPSRVLGRRATCGVGDRLGVAGDGHLRVFAACGVSPVLAQQSMRELNMTHRTYEDVIDAATFAVFRAGYVLGWGADGDHLKTEKDIQDALNVGCTMITLDCSDHIDAAAAEMTDEEILSSCARDAALSARYPEELTLEGETLHFSDAALLRAKRIYGEAIDFATSIYERFFAREDRTADFELSIDETTTPTSPEQHYFVANELYARGVRLETMAPRFVGEFQKGVDYIGDVAQFERELKAHCAIADYFGYKLSVHSGSDKFSVFPLIGKYTAGRFHLKTAGTSWLEAMRIVAEKDPALYREAHALALASFDKATKFYHVTTDLTKIPSLDTLTDGELPRLFDQNDARQLIHITYGYLLSDEVLKARLFALWRRERKAYADALYRHIGRHIEQVTGKALCKERESK